MISSTIILNIAVEVRRAMIIIIETIFKTENINYHRIKFCALKYAIYRYMFIIYLLVQNINLYRALGTS